MAGLVADARGVQTRCPHCGQTNRLPYVRLGRETRCGRCHQPLPHADGPVVVESAAVFDALVASSTLPVVVDFWAQWCGPCRAMAPEFERVAATTAGAWLVAKVDTDRVAELSERYRIRSIPTLIVFRGGAEAGRTSGAMPAAEIQRFMDESVR
jgi:thioredoxin 2